MNGVPFWELRSGELSEFLVAKTPQQLADFGRDFYDQLPWDLRHTATRIYPMVVSALRGELLLALAKIEGFEAVHTFTPTVAVKAVCDAEKPKELPCPQCGGNGYRVIPASISREQGTENCHLCGGVGLIPVLAMEMI